tara:strand:+ start:17386 stop:18264 length:879 start_codon:yes stop_codon:yes gene_type:complete
MAKKEFVNYNVDLTNREVELLGNELATLTLEISALEQEKKDFDKEQNEIIKEKDALRRVKAELLKQGYTVLNEECYLVINHQMQRREWVSLDTGEILRHDDIQPQDHQLSLVDPPFEDVYEDPEEVYEPSFFAEDALDDVSEEAPQEAPQEAVGEPVYLPDPEVFNETMRAAEDDAVALMQESSDHVEEDAETTDELEAETDFFGADEDENPLAGPAELSWTISDAHKTVVRTVANLSTTGQAVVSFSEGDRTIRAATDHLLGMGYLAGSGPSDVTGLTEMGERLLRDHVAA